MIYFYCSGRIDHYLTANGPFRFQCLLAGVGLCLLAVVNLGLVLFGKAFNHQHGVKSRNSLLGEFVWMGIPLVLAIRFTPDRYSDAFLMAKYQAAPPIEVAAVPASGGFTLAELERLGYGRNAEGNIPLDLDDLTHLARESDAVLKVLEGVRIETSGQLVRDAADPTRWRLSRLVVTCCAADARGVSLPLVAPGDPSLWRQLGWYRAIGRIGMEDSVGIQLLVFQVESLMPTEPPRRIMAY